MDATVKDYFMLGLYLFNIMEKKISILENQNLFVRTSIGADAVAQSLFLWNMIQSIICDIIDSPNSDRLSLADKLQIAIVAINTLGIQFTVEEALEFTLEKAREDILPDVCRPGYYLDGTACPKCDANEPQCGECHPTTGACSACIEGYWYDGSNCFSCS